MKLSKISEMIFQKFFSVSDRTIQNLMVGILLALAKVKCTPH